MRGRLGDWRERGGKLDWGGGWRRGGVRVRARWQMGDGGWDGRRSEMESLK